MGDLGDDVEPSVIVNLEQSLQGDISLDDVTPSPLSQPLTVELVVSEQSGRTNNCSSYVFDGLILNSGVGAGSVDDLSLCGGERVIVGSLSSGQLSSLHDREQCGGWRIVPLIWWIRKDRKPIIMFIF